MEQTKFWLAPKQKETWTIHPKQLGVIFLVKFLPFCIPSSGSRKNPPPNQLHDTNIALYIRTLTTADAALHTPNITIH